MTVPEIPEIEERPQCDGCFMECVQAHNGTNGGYPCNKALREWARKHRDDPVESRGFVYEQKGESDEL